MRRGSLAIIASGYFVWIEVDAGGFQQLGILDRLPVGPGRLDAGLPGLVFLALNVTFGRRTLDAGKGRIVGGMNGAAAFFIVDFGQAVGNGPAAGAARVVPD